MTDFEKCLASIAVAVCAASSLPAFATSSATSLASESITTSVGSASGSIQKSSASSSRPTPLAAGDYKIMEVVAAADRPGIVRMTLQAAADPSADGEFYLFVPQQAFEQSGLAAGHTVAALERPYGVEFANSATRQAFFLVLGDDWYRELQSNVVVL
jgi:hypothetical protein